VIWRPTLLHCSKGGTASAEAVIGGGPPPWRRAPPAAQIEDPQLRPACTDLVQELRSQPELEQRLRFCLEEGGRVADRACPALAGFAPTAGRRPPATARAAAGVAAAPWRRCCKTQSISERNGRPVLAVKSGGGVPAQAGLVHDTSASGSTVFIEPQAVIALGNRLREWEGPGAGRPRQRVLAELSGLVALQAEALGPFQEALVQLDFGLARARYGLELGAVRPELSADPASPWLLHGLRHPLLLWQQRHAGGQAVVPVSVTAAAALRWWRSPDRTPAAKTVSLKSVGLAALMARAGLFLLRRYATAALVLPGCSPTSAMKQSLQQKPLHLQWPCAPHRRILAALPEPALPQPAAGASLVLLDEVGAGTESGRGRGAGDRPVAPSGRSGPADAGHHPLR